MDAAIGEIRREGGGHVHLWVPKPATDHDGIAEANGLTRGRDLYQMRRPLPIDVPAPPLQTRAFVVSQDEEQWLRVNNRAFRGHPEQGTWELETIRTREKERWFDPQGFLLAEIDGRLAGSCWTKVHYDQDPPIGEIYVISVDPDFQGRHLGRDLVLAGLHHLQSIGLRTAMLYVDAGNEPAVNLYRSLGFEVDHVDRAYVGDVVPAGGAAAG